MRRKSIYSVREATELAFKKMDNKFHSIRLCQAVREITARPFLMDGTILRRLREMREDNPYEFNYTVINSNDGIYKKVKVKEPVMI
jgi:hypothetical protein